MSVLTPWMFTEPGRLQNKKGDFIHCITGRHSILCSKLKQAATLIKRNRDFTGMRERGRVQAGKIDSLSGGSIIGRMLEEIDNEPILSTAAANFVSSSGHMSGQYVKPK